MDWKKRIFTYAIYRVTCRILKQGQTETNTPWNCTQVKLDFMLERIWDFLPPSQTSRMFAWTIREVGSLSGIPHELSDTLSWNLLKSSIEMRFCRIRANKTNIFAAAQDLWDALFSKSVKLDAQGLLMFFSLCMSCNSILKCSVVKKQC